MATVFTSQSARPPRPPFHLMAKPIGPICNLDCSYCFYLEKEKLYPTGEHYRMTDEVLEKYVRSYITAQDAQEINFAWQGGEPTLMGVDFFRRAVEFQHRHDAGKTISNSLQTNGTLLDDEWGAFLAENKFLIGLSVDGPRKLHDLYRVDKRQKPTFDLVMRGLGFLKKHGVEFNTLTVVHRKNSEHPLEVYRFLKEIGAEHMQFIPLVERRADTQAKGMGLDLAYPPDIAGTVDPDSPVTPWSVQSRQYGVFLCAIFDEWVRRDVGSVFVQMFENTLGSWAGMGASTCVFQEKCGRALILEHTGDVYSCDHYMYPEYKVGNITERPLEDIASDPRQVKFGEDKSATLPQYCRECTVRFACNGECPKHRFITTPTGEPGLNYLCAGYKLYFTHVDAPMRAMAEMLARNESPMQIMALMRRQDAPDGVAAANGPCPCGSGRKWKNCCGRRGGTGHR
jgi:uncharacterized protein